MQPYIFNEIEDRFREFLLLLYGMLELPMFEKLVESGSDGGYRCDEREREWQPPELAKRVTAVAAASGCLKERRQHHALEDEVESEELIDLVLCVAPATLLVLDPLSNNVLLFLPLLELPPQCHIVFDLLQRMRREIRHCHLMLMREIGHGQDCAGTRCRKVGTMKKHKQQAPCLLEMVLSAL